MSPPTVDLNSKLQLLNNQYQLPLKPISTFSNLTNQASLQAVHVEPLLIMESSLLDMEPKPQLTIIQAIPTIGLSRTRGAPHGEKMASSEFSDHQKQVKESVEFKNKPLTLKNESWEMIYQQSFIKYFICTYYLPLITI